MTTRQMPQPIENQDERLQDLEIGDSMFWRLNKGEFIKATRELLPEGKTFGCVPSGPNTVILTRLS